LDLALLYVARHADVDWSFSRHHREPERIAQYLDSILRRQRRAHFRYRREYLALGDLVPGRGALPRRFAPYVRGEPDQRDRFFMSIRDAGKQIGRAGSGRDEADARRPARLGVRRRHIGGGALVQRRHESDRRIAVERVGDVEDGMAGYAEDGIDIRFL